MADTPEEEPDRHIDDKDILPRNNDFVPTVARPLPCYRCNHILSNGERCKNNAEMGYTEDNALCWNHSKKQHVSARDRREKLIEAARMKMEGDVDKALRTLSVLMEPGAADGVRLKAATEILDRVGLRAGVEIDISGEVNVATTDEIKGKLAKLLENSGLLEVEDAIDAEIVEDEDGTDDPA